MGNKTKKEAMIAELKEEMSSHILDSFTEDYEFWKSRMEMINSMILHVDENTDIFKYNEFCVKAKEVVANTMDNVINFNSLFLTKKEVDNIREKFSDNQKKIEKEMLLQLNKKYEENLHMVVNKKIMTETIKFKLKEKFELIEQELEDSFSLATSQLNQTLNENNKIK